MANVFDNEVVLESTEGAIVFRDFVTGANVLAVLYTATDPNGVISAPQGSIASGASGAWQNTDGADTWSLIGSGGGQGFWYGSGLDGDATYSDLTQTFTRNMEFQTLNADTTATLVVNPGSSTYLDLSATVSITLNNVVLQCAGDPGGQANTFQGAPGGLGGGGSTAGFNGQDAGIGSSPAPPEQAVLQTLSDDTASTVQPGGPGGDGAAGVTTGGAGTVDAGSTNELFTMLRQFQSVFNPIAVGGGGGGPGGGDGIAAKGGGSGGGGGAGGGIVLRAPIITLIDVTFDIHGGDGGNGADGEPGATGGGGAGTGGDAGIVLFITEVLTGFLPINVNNAGGFAGSGGNAGGVGGAPGGEGLAGRPGRVFWYRPSTNVWTVLL